MVAVDVLMLHAAIAAGSVHVATKPDSWSRPIEKQTRRRWMWCVWCVLFVLLALEVRRPTLNHYEVLRVPVTISKRHLVSHYRQVSAHFSSTRLAALTESERQSAEALLSELTLAFETLSNDTKRRMYDRFGDMAFDGQLLQDSSGISVVALAVAIYVVCFVLAYFASIPSRFCRARTFAAMFCLGAFALELHWRFIGTDNDWTSNLPWISQMLPFERVELLRRCFPAFLGIMLLGSNFLFDDRNEAVLRLLHATVLANRLLCQQLAGLSQKAAASDGTSSSGTPGGRRSQRDSRKETLQASSVTAAQEWSSVPPTGSDLRVPTGSDLGVEEQPATTHPTEAAAAAKTYFGFTFSQLMIFTIVIAASYFSRR